MNTTLVNQHRSSLGTDANIMVVIAFVATIVLGWIPWIGWIAWAVPLVIFFLEKDSLFVKRQMVQLLCLAAVRAAVVIVVQILLWILVPATIAGSIFSLVSGGVVIAALLTLVSAIIGLAITVVEVIVVVNAYGWKQLELPVLWPLVEKFTSKLNGLNI